MECIHATLDATDIYFVTTAGVYRVPRAGGGVTALAQGPGGFGMAIDETSVYFTDGTHINRISKCGGPVSTLGTVSGTVQTLAVDSSSVYWVTSGDSWEGAS